MLLIFEDKVIINGDCSAPSVLDPNILGTWANAAGKTYFFSFPNNVKTVAKLIKTVLFDNSFLV
jgi:hypothetical protein